RAGSKHFQATVVEIGLEQMIQREQCRKGGAQHHDSSSDGTQQGGLWTDPQWNKRDDSGKERQREKRAATTSPCQAHIAADQSAKAHCSSSDAPCTPSGSWGAATTIPPFSQCSLTCRR